MKIRRAPIGASLLALTACYDPSELSVERSSNRGRAVDLAETAVVRYRDPETWCEYLATSANPAAGITPRLNRDGSPMCGGN